jgi:hypothetical protein
MAQPSKLANLQTALNSTRAVPAPAETRPAPSPSPPRAASRQANRQGKVNIAAWMSPEFKNSIRLVQARRPGSIQELMEEALNDLFAKYDVPQVHSTEG